MKSSILWMLIGILPLIACGTPNAFLQKGDSPETVQTVAVQASATLPMTLPVSLPSTPTTEATLPAITQVSPLTTPTTEATLSKTAHLSPLPTPTVELASTPFTETPPLSQTEAAGQVSNKPTKTLDETVIIYRRSGGIIGLNEVWTINSDGRITVNDGREWQVTSERVEQLLADLEALGFFKLDNRYIPGNTCCDRFTYDVTVWSGDKMNQVTTIDAAPNAPPELWQVISEISRLLAEAQEG